MTLADGEVVVAARARPTASADLAYGPAAPDLQISPRVAPQMIGLGLLEAMPEAGHPRARRPGRRRRRRHHRPAEPRLVGGRRPRRCSAASAGRPASRRSASSRPRPSPATSASRPPLHPDGWGDCTEAPGRLPRRPPTAAPRRPGGRRHRPRPRHLLQPQPRGARPARPRRPAGARAASRSSTRPAAPPATARSSSPTASPDQPEQSFQLIWPYTDLLLHDMGEGLADHRPEGPRHRHRMAHRAALGHRPDRDRHRPDELPARRPRPHPARGHPLARRRGASRPRHRRRPAQGRPRRPRPLPGVALMRFPGAHSRPATSAEARRRPPCLRTARRKDPEARRRNARPINGHGQKVNAADVIHKYQQLDPRRARATPRDSTPPARPLGPPRSPI